MKISEQMNFKERATMNKLFYVLLVLSLAGSCSKAEKGKKADSTADGRKEVMTGEPYAYHGEPLRIAVIGLEHDHVGWILGRENYGDIEIVGIVEPNRDLAERYCNHYGFPMNIVFDSMKEMADSKHPEAVTAFNRISDHVKVVEFCAPRGMHVMVEKPLATNLKDAERMIALVNEHQIHLITNYETSWYGSNAEAYHIVHNEKRIGDIRRMIFRTGHKGPVEIGCSPEFLKWLTDPVLNGGGALMDFGCYGANLATWFMKGEAPQTVLCVTQQIKPEIYPKVDDEAIIILTYPKAQVIIQASWNWSVGRKEMEIHGTTGYVICQNGQDMTVRQDEAHGAVSHKAEALPNGIHDPFAFLVKVIREDYAIEPWGVSSPENGKRVMQILDAAKYAAKTGRTVDWDGYFGKK
jgi:predicted dehydrogenase